jgi:hypothetical protein
MRKGAQLLKTGPASPALQLGDEASADPERSRAPINDQRAHFGDAAAERRKFRAADDSPAPDGDDEPIRVDGELVVLTRKEPSFLEMRLDERVQCRGFT